MGASGKRFKARFKNHLKTSFHKITATWQKEGDHEQRSKENERADEKVDEQLQKSDREEHAGDLQMFARGFFVAKHGLPITVFQHLREHDKLSARLLGGPETESRVKDRVRTG